MDQNLRQHIIYLLEDGGAHMSFPDAVADFSEKAINQKVPNVDYSFWHLIEHIRITQWDILDFCVNPNYKYLKWPDDYWPAKTKKLQKKIGKILLKVFRRT